MSVGNLGGFGNMSAADLASTKAAFTAANTALNTARAQLLVAGGFTSAQANALLNLLFPPSA